MRAGDTVKHGPTGETWTVAYADHDTGHMSWQGWPEGKAKISDCTVTKACTGEEHIAVLLAWSTSKRKDDLRRRNCERQLRELEEIAGEPFSLRDPVWLAGELERSARTCDRLREQMCNMEKQIKRVLHERHLMNNAHYKMTFQKPAHSLKE